jgi:hypothetical protein
LPKSEKARKNIKTEKKYPAASRAFWIIFAKMDLTISFTSFKRMGMKVEYIIQAPGPYNLWYLRR